LYEHWLLWLFHPYIICFLIAEWNSHDWKIFILIGVSMNHAHFIRINFCFTFCNFGISDTILNNRSTYGIAIYSLRGFPIGQFIFGWYKLLILWLFHINGLTFFIFGSYSVRNIILSLIIDLLRTV
jgi:hypothetical protein